MSRDWEAKFNTWAQGPSKTEQEKAENAERQIRQAIHESSKLRERTIKVFTQGSYRNRVNVRHDSDVDIGVLCSDVFFSEYPDNNVKTLIERKYINSEYTYSIFKDELEVALVARFGRAAVSRGNKSFDIKENSYRVESDVGAFFEHRRYNSYLGYTSGVEMIPDNNKPPRIHNWPEQHYENGVYKNDCTARQYKRVVRILKSLSNTMSVEGIRSAKDTPSFLVECLVYNASNSCFNYSTYMQIVREVIIELFIKTETDEKCSKLLEVSELKYLFWPSQPWTRESANQFLLDAWVYIGYK